MEASDLAYLVMRLGIACLWLVAAFLFTRYARGAGHRFPAWLKPAGLVFILLLAAFTVADGIQNALVEPLAVRRIDWAWMPDDVAAPLFLMALLRVLRLRDEAHEHIENLAMTDRLTGLPNRHGFAVAGHAALAQARREGRPSTFLLMDLDRFKRINDGFGHEAGDQVLAGVAAVLRASLRAGDVPLRFGGEELGALLPGTTLEEAASVAERLRRALPLGVPHPAGPAERVTGSIGVSQVGPGEAEVALRQASIAADMALYRAKQAGRDRVELAAG